MSLARILLDSAATSALVATMALSAPSARADEKVSIMVGGYEKQIYLPAKLTEALGYFKDEGLDVELLNEPAGVDAENEMLAGAVQGLSASTITASICRRRANSSNRSSNSARRRARSSLFRPNIQRSNRPPISRV